MVPPITPSVWDMKRRRVMLRDIRIPLASDMLSYKTVAYNSQSNSFSYFEAQRTAWQGFHGISHDVGEYDLYPDCSSPSLEYLSQHMVHIEAISMPCVLVIDEPGHLALYIHRLLRHDRIVYELF